MKDQTFSPGIGSMVPPERKHVEIYFIAQGATEEDAAEFYDLYKKKNGEATRVCLFQTGNNMPGETYGMENKKGFGLEAFFYRDNVQYHSPAFYPVIIIN
ncbi:hypothetical protein [Pedobacter sp.]